MPTIVSANTTFKKGDDSTFPLAKLVTLLKLLRLLRVRRLMRYLDAMKNALYARVMILFTTVIMIAHWCACAFAMLCWFEEDAGGQSWFTINERSAKVKLVIMIIMYSRALPHGPTSCLRPYRRCRPLCPPSLFPRRAYSSAGRNTPLRQTPRQLDCGLPARDRK